MLGKRKWYPRLWPSIAKRRIKYPIQILTPLINSSGTHSKFEGFVWLFEMVYVSLLIHHGGTLRDGDGSFKYEGGELHYWEYIDVDMISYLDIEEELRKLGYGDIHLYVEALEGQDSKGENQLGIDIGAIQGTPQSKLNENDAISLNYEMFDSNDIVLGDNENNVEKGTSVDPAEKCLMVDDDKSEDLNYDPDANRMLTGDDELENEVFDDYVTDDSEFQSVRKGQKKKTISDNVVGVTDMHEVPRLVFDDMVNEDIPSNLNLPFELDSDDLSHTPAPSDEDDFEEHMRETRGDILYDPECDHA
ncbi:hypothetical protein GH714_037775 [Hevea brasiliensis]|uniref:PB1-like domain-containing protein n=1 Tax=Hevea brasiliensis TaxID=3981 RepID=A0A6A6M3G1_HEVBR|nr:hypothetical protein GH714_037775 [Hevea brasiliensis]